MTAITLDNFNTDTDQNNNRHISLVWQKNKQKVFASTFILDVTKGENLLFLNITLQAVIIKMMIAMILVFDLKFHMNH